MMIRANARRTSVRRCCSCLLHRCPWKFVAVCRGRSAPGDNRGADRSDAHRRDHRARVPAADHALRGTRSGGTAYFYDAAAGAGDQLRHEALANPQATHTPGPSRAMPNVDGPSALPIEPGGRPSPPLANEPIMPPDPGQELPSSQGRPLLELPGRYWRAGWIYELKRPNGSGFAYPDIAQILVDGTGVVSTLLPDTCVRTAVPNIEEGGCGAPTSARAFVRFAVADAAAPGPRQVTVRLKNGSVEPAQYPLLVGRNGTAVLTRLTYLDLPSGSLMLTNQDIRSIQGAEAALDAPLVDVEVSGQRLGNAKFVAPCLLEGGVPQVTADERRVVLRSRFRHTSGRTVQPNGQIVLTRPAAFGPFDQCPWLLYDAAMDQAVVWAPTFPGTAPENFNYLDYAKPEADQDRSERQGFRASSGRHRRLVGARCVRSRDQKSPSCGPTRHSSSARWADESTCSRWSAILTIAAST